MTNLLILYSAGTLGALAKSLLGWGAASAGLFRAAGSALHPQLAFPALYSTLVWGGVWGATYLFPGIASLPLLQGSLLLALFPTAGQLLYFLPRAGDGWFGMNLGASTPFLVFLLNWAWALVTTFFARRERLA